MEYFISSHCTVSGHLKPSLPPPAALHASPVNGCWFPTGGSSPHPLILTPRCSHCPITPSAAPDQMPPRTPPLCTHSTRDAPTPFPAQPLTAHPKAHIHSFSGSFCRTRRHSFKPHRRCRSPLPAHCPTPGSELSTTAPFRHAAYWKTPRCETRWCSHQLASEPAVPRQPGAAQQALPARSERGYSNRRSPTHSTGASLLPSRADEAQSPLLQQITQRGFEAVESNLYHKDTEKP